MAMLPRWCSAPRRALHQTRVLRRHAGRGEQPHRVAVGDRRCADPCGRRSKPVRDAPLREHGDLSRHGLIGITVSGGDGADSLTNSTTAQRRPRRSPVETATTRSRAAPRRHASGNQGVDSVSGGAGDDLIDVRGDRSDIATCGPGDDTVRADGADLVASDCETVDRGGAPPPSPPQPTSGPSPTAGALLGPVETGTLDRGACAMDKLGTQVTIAWAAPPSATTYSASRGRCPHGQANAIASSAASDPTAWPARRATTACWGTTRVAQSPATTGSSGTLGMTCCGWARQRSPARRRRTQPAAWRPRQRPPQRR